jgi:uncharacterized protein (DUF1800 family)
MPATTKQLVAHVLRRMTFGPFPGQVEELAPLGVEGVIEELLSRRPRSLADPPDTADDSSDAPVRWWLDQMSDRDAGVHEKMTWILHGIVTVSHDKVFWWAVEWQAHKLLRKHAMGSYRTLLKKMTITPAMLIYLDGSWSTIQGPNENYSREIQELFGIGQPLVTETNVRNGALALAGWYVDWETATSHFIDERWASLGQNQKKRFLGTWVYRYDQVVDAVCDHPNMPRFIAEKVWYQLVGTRPSAAKLDALARVYRASGLSNRRLVEAIVRDPAFLQKRFTRPRYPIEWVVSAMAAMGMGNDRQRMVDLLWSMGNLPFYPPSVAGWPTGMGWLSPAMALTKAAAAVDSPAIAEVVEAADPVAAALRRCSIHEVSPRTRQALQLVVSGPDKLTNPTKRARVLLALCLASPEYALA